MREMENTPEGRLAKYKLDLESRYTNPEVFFTTEETISQEMIAYQNDPSFIKRACDGISVVVEASGKGNTNLARKDGKETLTQLEGIFQERFGVDFIFGFNDGWGAFCIPFGSRVRFDYGDYVDYHTTYQELDKYLANEKNQAVVTGEVPKAKNDRDRYDLYAYYKDGANASYFSFMEQVRKNGVELDLKNARFMNATKNMKFYVNVDWNGLKNNYGLTEKEILAVILHEIGHCWTHWEYCYKVFASVQVLNDVVREEYAKKNKTPVDTIKVFYNKTGLPETKSDAKDMATLTIKAYKDILRGSAIGLASNHSTTDSEQQADEFATRFGLGKEIVTALNKLAPGGWNRYDYIGDALTSMTLMCVVGILSVAMTAPAAALGLAGISAMLLGFIGFESLGSLHDKSRWITYDDSYMRYKRVRNTMVRRLVWVEDKAVKNEILDNIDAVDKIYKQIELDTKSSIWKKISDWICSDKASFDAIKVDELLEAMSANEIHVAAARLSNMKIK